MKYRMARCSVFITVLTLLWVAVAQGVPFDPGGTDQKKPETIEQATTHLRAGRPAAAIALLQKALAKTPGSVRLRYYLGLAYAANNELGLAEAQFRTVLREDADYIDAHIRIAEVLSRKLSAANTTPQNLSICVAAAKELARALEKSPKRTDLHYKLVDAHLRCTSFRKTGAKADFEKAIALLKAVRALEPKRVRSYLRAGNIYLGQASITADGKKFSELKGKVGAEVKGLFAEAEASYQQALKLDPSSLVALIRTAAMRAQQNDLKGAVAALEAHIPKLKEDTAKIAVCYRQIGLYLIRSGDLDGAEVKLKKATETNPRELASYLLLARIFNARKELDEAAEMLLSATKAAPTFLNAYVQLGQLELSRRNLPESERYFQYALNIPASKAVAVSLSDVPAQNALRDLYTRAAMQLGNILASQARFDDAIAAFRKLKGITPRSAVPDFQIGEIYRRRGMLEKARNRYESALRKNRNFTSALIALAEVTVAEANDAATDEIRSQILTRAITQYDAVLKLQPASANVLSRIAALHVSLSKAIGPTHQYRELERALASIKAAQKLKPDSNAFRHQFARIHNEMGNKDEAVAELRVIIKNLAKAVKEKPDNIGAVLTLADMRALLHSWKPDKKVLKQAIEGYAAVVKKQPGMMSAYVRATRALDAEKDYEAMAKWLKDLLKVSMGAKEPDQLSGQQATNALRAAANLAWIYVEHLNDLKQATKYSEIALKFDPKLPALLDTQGWIYYKKGDYVKALPALRSALREDENNPVIGYHLGATLAKRQNPLRAREALKHALKHVGNDDELRAKIEKLLRTVQK